MGKQLKMTYALQNGAVLHISEVESGLKCMCVCPGCGSPLIAKKGQKVIHHFAHKPGTECEYGYESSLHHAAKDILSNAEKIFIPAVYVHFPNSYKNPEIVSKAREIRIDRVELEKRLNDIVPDVVVYSGNRSLLIEIFVTHKVDEEKLEKINRADMSTIEIDLSKIEREITPQDLSDILISDNAAKTWIYNSAENRILQKYIQIADKKQIIHRGFARHVDYCPKKARIWCGKSYANVFYDCADCEFCVSTNYNGVLLCLGRTGITSILDTRNYASINKTCGIDESSDTREESFARGVCPKCGGKIVERHSQYGVFWGCVNFPKCKFSASPNYKTGEIIIKD